MIPTTTSHKAVQSFLLYQKSDYLATVSAFPTDALYLLQSVDSFLRSAAETNNILAILRLPKAIAMIPY